MSETMTHEQAVESIKAFLEMQDRAVAVPAEWVTLPHKLLLEHGRACDVTPETYSGAKGAPGSCYMNAGRRALNTFENLTYVEGQITCHGIPLEHAWVITLDGKVIDPTLKSGDGIAGYFGIAFTEAYVRYVGLKTRVWGVLSIESNMALFEKGLPKGALA